MLVITFRKNRLAGIVSHSLHRNRCGWVRLAAILSPSSHHGRLLLMATIGRYLQMLGLAIAPLAMVFQLGGDLSVGNMLKFLFFSVGVFVLGYTLQRYSGSSQ
jgi:hypothetical protein